MLWALEMGGSPAYQLVLGQRRHGFEADVLVGAKGGFYAERTRETGAHVHELHQRGALDLTVGRRAAHLFARYPIIHLHSAEPLLVALAARQRTSRRFYTHRAGDHQYPLRKRARHRIVAHYLRRQFDGISANSAQGAEAAAAIYGLPLNSIHVVYNGLDFASLAPQRSRDNVLSELGEGHSAMVRVGTAAILRPLKRIDRLLRAIHAIRNEPVHCYVFGDGPARGELEQLTVNLGIAGRVTFTGHKSHIGDYLQMLDIFVLPTGPEESFGNAAVEAMALAVPTVVFSDGGGLTEHIEDGVTGVVVPDQIQFERRLRELVRNQALRQQLGDAGKDAVRSRYTLDAMVERYEHLYDAASPQVRAG